MLVLVVSCLLVSCAEDAGPQFASDPMPTPAQEWPTRIATPVPTVGPPAIATPASIAEVIMSRGAPAKIYFIDSQAVWSVVGAADAVEVFRPPAGARLIAIDAAPGGERVAALVERGDASPAAEVLVLDAEGNVARRFAGIVNPGTPTPGPGSRVSGIDWSPQGDQLLVWFRDGVIFHMPLTGDATPSARRLLSGDADIRQAAWSPTGQSVAILAVEAGDGRRVVQVHNTVTGEVATIRPASDARTLVEFAWMPDGASLLFTEGAVAGGPVSGVDLWRIDVTGAERELVASAGTVAPVARIATIRPSPDGRSVAYIALIPSDDGPRFDSVWVRDLASRGGFRVEMPKVETVDDLWWTDEGLVIAAVQGQDAGADSATLLLRVDANGVAEVIWTSPRPSGTPTSATPVGSPITR